MANCFLWDNSTTNSFSVQKLPFGLGIFEPGVGGKIVSLGFPRNHLGLGQTQLSLLFVHPTSLKQG
jgi:hypothetical protein